jgi:hypothetical protein
MKDFADFKRIEYSYGGRWEDLNQENIDILSKWRDTESSSAHAFAWGVLHLLNLTDLLPEPEDPDTGTRMHSNGEAIVDFSEVSEKLWLSPNPCSDFLVVGFPREEQDKGIISIFDGSGKLVLQNSGNPNGIQEVDTSKLPIGIYVITFTGRYGNLLTKRFEILR